MKIQKEFSILFSVLVITGVLFSGCGQTEPTATVDTVQTQTQEEMSVTTPTQETSEVSGSTTQEDSSMASQEIKNDSSSQETTQETSTVSYENGTYSESASYKSPAGDEEVTFEFTVADNAVTGIEMSSPTKNDISKKFQAFFIEGIRKEVVGKKIDEIGTFTRVNGSSLTVKAFNESVTLLKEEAKA